MKRILKIAGFTATIVSSAAYSTTSNDAHIESEIHALQLEAQHIEQQADRLATQLPYHDKSQIRYSQHLMNTQKANKIITASRNAVGRTNTGSVRMLGGLTVITTPYFTDKPAWDGSDLLVNVPTMNEDLRLLQLKSELNKHYQELGIPFNQRPVIEISGAIEGDIYQGNSYGRTISDIDLGRGEIDFNADISKWASGFLSIDYDGAPVITGNRVGRVSNSRLYLRRGFLTIGDLDVLPIYFTIGQFYVPFGQYNSAMVTSPLTQTLFRTNTRAALLGFSEDGVYAQAYAYHCETHKGTDTNVNEWGTNLGYNSPVDQKFIYGFGAGYISNVADSQGMLNNGNEDILTNFQGFDTRDSSLLQHLVPGLDLHGNMGFGHFNFFGEYITSLTPFAAPNMSFNLNGAKPAAIHAEADYSNHWWGRPITFGMAFGETWQALALNVPEYSYTLVGNISIWKDTIESLEYRHDINYGSTTQANGGNRASTPGNTPIFGTAKRARNIVTLQVGVYF